MNILMLIRINSKWVLDKISSISRRVTITEFKVIDSGFKYAQTIRIHNCFFCFFFFFLLFNDILTLMGNLIPKSYHHHHHVALLARISLTLSHHLSISSIAPGRSSRIHPVSIQSCCIYVLAGRPAFARPCDGIHKSMSLMSSSQLLQQYPACLVRLT